MNGVAEMFELGQRIAWRLICLMCKILILVCWTLPILFCHWLQSRKPVAGRLPLDTWLADSDTTRSGVARDQFEMPRTADARSLSWAEGSAPAPQESVDATPWINHSSSFHRLSTMTHGDYLRRHS
jgi:hypothetical protein